MTTVSFRKRFERIAALLLAIASTVVVGTGTVIMCTSPLVG